MKQLCVVFIYILKRRDGRTCDASLLSQSPWSASPLTSREVISTEKDKEIVRKLKEKGRERIGKAERRRPQPIGRFINRFVDP